jgi:hypothetical protein
MTKHVTLKLTLAEAVGLELIAEEGFRNAADVLEGQAESTEQDVFRALEKLRAAIGKAQGET